MDMVISFANSSFFDLATRIEFKLTKNIKGIFPFPNGNDCVPLISLPLFDLATLIEVNILTIMHERYIYCFADGGGCVPLVSLPLFDLATLIETNVILAAKVYEIPPGW